MKNISDVWEYIDYKRPTSIKKSNWKRSYHGVCQILIFFNIFMTTSRDEFHKLKIPHSNNKNYYMRRKIQVLYPNGKISKPSTIEGILKSSFKRFYKKNTLKSSSYSDREKIDDLFFDDDMQFFSYLLKSTLKHDSDFSPNIYSN